MASIGFEEKMEKACEDLLIPGAIVSGGDKSGRYHYEKAFGKRSLKDSAAGPMKLDACMWLASCTKLVTTISAMQCVERGLLKLDDDVTTILHELRGAKILTGFNEETGEPNLVENSKPITLRRLLTHSSGLSYDVFNPLLRQYAMWEKRPVNLKIQGTVPETHCFPLLFEPGERWEYSAGIDWAGVMVERVNDNISLEDYMHKNILGPLGIKNFTFHPNSAPHVLERMTDMSERAGGAHPIFGVCADPEGKVGYTDNTVWNWDTPGCHGGAGGFGNVVEYQKILQSLCADDGKLLKQATTAEMFAPQLTEASKKALAQLLYVPEINQTLCHLPQGTKLDWGIGGMLIMEDLQGERRKGTMIWGGYPNLMWFVDRAGGMSGMFGSQISRPGDNKANEFYSAWLKDLYSNAHKERL